VSHGTTSGPPDGEHTEPDRPLSDRVVLALLATISAAGPIALNIYLPALPAVHLAFDAPVPQVQLTLTVSLLSFAVGQLLYGPLSDRFGRRPAVLCGILVFCAGTLLCLSAPNLYWLLAGRAVQALGSSAGLVISRAIVSDLYPREKMVRMIAYLTMVMVVAPTVSPLLGGVLVDAFGWRGPFVFMAVAGLAILWIAWRLLPETRRPVGTHPDAAAMFRRAGTLLRRPIFAGYVLQGVIVFSVHLVFISITPYIMVTGLGRPPTEYGTYFVLVAGGYFLGNFSVTRFAARRAAPALLKVGVGISTAATLVALGLAWVGLKHPLWLFVPIGVMAFGHGITLPNVSASVVGLAPESAGLASSLLGFTQQLMGALCVQWMSTFPVDTALPVLIFCASASLIALVVLQFSRRVLIR
jgi:DHA1 family bicyclomycin/chloramphenicol resistance-like MFS transporter